MFSRLFPQLGTPSKDKFAALVLQKIKEAGGPSNFAYLQEAFEIRSGTNRGFLENVYASYCHAPRTQRKVILTNYVSAMIAQTDSTELPYSEIEGNLVTVVRERVLFAFTSLLWELDGVEKPPRQQAEPISDWFAKALVIDAPGHMSLVNEGQAKEWLQTADEVFATGLAKLKDSTVPKFAEDRGVFRGTWNDDYDSSRILVPGIFDDLPLRGDPIVTLPNRLTLLVAGSDDHDAVRRMLEMAEEIVRTQPRPQNPAPLLVKDGEIRDYSVECGSPLFHAVERAKRVTALMYYQEQKETLEKLHDKNPKDVFVATYTLTKLDSGEHVSHAVWTKGVPTLLPVADEIVFVDTDLPEGETVLARAKWDVVGSLLSDLMLDTKMFPQRYYASGFPSGGQISQLGQDIEA